ncbi:hypothetical protein TREMEDRAFT_19626, partial [Tremella mesenterica DSM 1558]|uniref:uncharacterized protein n=1 Tax=Tremella mesenterica (strain ATCC 24925 / CBS 8224 / DSM 1558 / NBRC 9311 / NRRL Y-6157 / RJB 2259-6 / UBC 559-6) TaxID=578456 RepID=UPI00032CF696
LVMQIILRRDLMTTHGWPLGPMMAQSAHAATAVLHVYRDHPNVKTYLEGEDGNGFLGMRKVVMETVDEDSLRSLVSKLDSLSPKIPYHMWIEQPENIPTALALIPNNRPKALKKILEETGCTLWR